MRTNLKYFISLYLRICLTVRGLPQVPIGSTYLTSTKKNEKTSSLLLTEKIGYALLVASSKNLNRNSLRSCKTAFYK